MKPEKQMKIVLLGSLLVTGAWAAGRGSPPGAEPAPMETLEGASELSTSVSWDLTSTDPRNDRVDQWIDFLAGRNADKTRLWMERSGRYTPMIREQLRARGMPEDLIYLAFIESGYSPKAYSKAAASGIWQFIAETGRRYDLEITSYVDERRDPIDATRAALDYLSELHDRFGSWYLAAAAYNSGENRVERILRERAGGLKGDDELFWTIAPYLPAETRNYVPLMLAAGHIGKSPEQYGFTGVDYQERLAFDTAWVPAQSSLALVAKASGVEESAVRELNPHLLKNVTPPGRAWAVRIPEGSKVAFTTNFAVLSKAERELEQQRVKLASVTVTRKAKAATTRSSRVHRVRRGENLTVIANRYDLSIKRLQSINGLGRKSRIFPGQRLKVG